MSTQLRAASGLNPLFIPMTNSERARLNEDGVTVDAINKIIERNRAIAESASAGKFLSSVEAMQLLAHVAELNVNALPRIREFFDDRPVVGCSEVDREATIRAGHTVLKDEPSDGLLECLSAVLALESV